MRIVIHDWRDEQAVAILRNVRTAAGADGTVLLVELVLPRHHREFLGNWVDLEMLLGANGRERTAAKYRELLGQAGLRDGTGGGNRDPSVSLRQEPRKDPWPWAGDPVAVGRECSQYRVRGRYWFSSRRDAAR